MTALLPISTVFKMVKSSREPLDVSKDVSTCEHTWMLSHLLALRSRTPARGQLARSVIPPPPYRALLSPDRAMPINLGTPIITAAAAADSSTPTPIPEEEEFYSSWSLFLVCLLLILSLWTSYYLQIKRIRAIHETVVSIIAGMVVGFTVRIAPGHLIREMLVSWLPSLW